MTLIQKPLVFLLILPWVLLFAMKPPKAPAGLISKKIANRVYVPAGNWNQVALLLSSALAPSGNAPQRVPSGAPDNFSATELTWGAPHSKALHLIKSQTAIPQDSLSITVSGPVTVINCNSYKADQARAFIRYFKKSGLKIKKDVDELPKPGQKGNNISAGFTVQVGKALKPLPPATTAGPSPTMPRPSPFVEETLEVTHNPNYPN